MTKTKMYSLDIAGELYPYKLDTVEDIGSTIAVLDKKSSTVIRFASTEELTIDSKRIFDISTKRNKTTILSNTTDVYATDVVHNGIPQYYKAIVALPGSTKSIKVDGEDALFDEHFVYTNSQKPFIEYFDANQNTLLATEQETFSIFINEASLNLKDIYLLDNKKIKVSQDGEKIKSSFTKTVTNSYVLNEDVSKVKLLTDSIAYVDGFIARASSIVNSRKIDFLYDYSVQIVDTKSITSKRFIVDKELLSLGNINVIPSSIIIQHGLNTLGIGNQIKRYSLNSKNGTINLAELIKNKVINIGDELHITYKYITYNGRYLDLSDAGINLINKKINFYITPSNRTADGILLPGDNKLLYSVFGGNGIIERSSDDTITTPMVTPIIAHGFSEGVYGEYGYSGIEEVTDEAIALTEPVYETGYGYNGYGMGPYGGRFVQSEKDVEDILEAANSEFGLMKIGSVVFDVSIEAAGFVYDFKQPIINDNVYQHVKINMYPNFIVNIGENDNFNMPAGNTIIDIGKTISMDVDIISDEVITCYPPGNPNVTVVDSDLLYLFNENNFGIDLDYDIDEFVPFVNGTKIAIVSSSYDESTNALYFKIEPLKVGDSVGIGYKNIKPGNVVVL